MKSKQSILDVLWEYVDTFNPYASEDEKKILGIVAEKSNNFKNIISESEYLIF